MRSTSDPFLTETTDLVENRSVIMQIFLLLEVMHVAYKQRVRTGANTYCVNQRIDLVGC